MGLMGPDAIFGIQLEGAEALHQLADAIFSSPRYQRATTFPAVLRQLANIIITDFVDKKNVAVQAVDVPLLEGKMAIWLETQIAPREFYVPCLISPRPAASFTIGPVRFTHIQDFAPAARADAGESFDLTFAEVFRQMQGASATWMGTVSIDGCTNDRAEETANLAVDLALTGLQLCLPERGAQHMARMTGRTMPVLRKIVSRSSGQLWSAGINAAPGLAFGPGFLDQQLTQVRPVLDSVGSRVSAFLTGSGRLMALEQAWLDAAYWFHEGLAEPLDTIAVSKFEIAVEVLLRAESTRGSKARLLKAFRAFYGRKPGDFIDPESETTVEQFAAGLVRDRSRVLHGTWSTLAHSLRATRPILARFVRGLLADYTHMLDEFAALEAPDGEIEAFLNFVEERRRRVLATAEP
jgi:hypothetical protein